MLVKPATVIQWHPQGFRLYWLPHAEEAQKAPVCGMKAVTCGMAMNLRAGRWKLSRSPWTPRPDSCTPRWRPERLGLTTHPYPRPERS
jgi:hypothetical protein